MYHTEGFLDKNTYFSKEHIWSFAMAQRGSLCLFWCVVEGENDGQDERKTALETWFLRELTHALEKGGATIQKELNRLENWLSGFDKAQKDVKSPKLYLYFQGKIYACRAEGSDFRQYREHRGVIMWPYNRADVWDERTIEEAANDLKVSMLKTMSRGELELGYFMLWEDAYDF